MQSAQVNLATETVHIVLDSNEFLRDAVGAIEKAGYGVIQENIDLNVSGMRCASCVGRVEKGLLRFPGVLSAQVNLATESARIISPIGVLSLEQLENVLDKLGYPVKPTDDVSRETLDLHKDVSDVSRETFAF